MENISLSYCSVRAGTQVQIDDLIVSNLTGIHLEIKKIADPFFLEGFYAIKYADAQNQEQIENFSPALGIRRVELLPGDEGLNFQYYMQ